MSWPFRRGLSGFGLLLRGVWEMKDFSEIPMMQRTAWPPGPSKMRIRGEREGKEYPIILKDKLWDEGEYLPCLKSKEGEFEEKSRR